ncbi:hypothetical protein GQ457_05G022890 [Hibiscus cannabinus]
MQKAMELSFISKECNLVISLTVEWEAYTLFLLSRNRGNRFGMSERGIGSSRKVKTDFRLRSFPTMQIASLVEARRQEDQGIKFCSSPETFREGSETFSLMVPKPCPKVSKPWTEFSVRTERF